MIIDVRAPLPDAKELFGFESFQTRYKTNPTIGKKKPNTAYPKLPVSISDDDRVFFTEAPQLRHTTAFSLTSAPQLEQYFIFFPPNDFFIMSKNVNIQISQCIIKPINNMAVNFFYTTIIDGILMIN